MDSPWDGLVGGVVLGDVAEAVALLRRAAKNPDGQAEARRRVADRMRPEWIRIVGAAESILGRKWDEMTVRHGDWGRDGTLAVATRHLGWRLVAVVKQISGLKYAAGAQGIRRFWKQAEVRPELANFAARLREHMSIIHV